MCIKKNSIFSASTATQNILVDTTTTSTQRVRINKCGFSASVTKTLGDAIQINGSGGISNYGAIIDGVNIEAQYNGIHMASASHWSIRDPIILAGSNYDIYIQNTIATDSGDSNIIGGVLDNSITTGSAIRYESGGGLKVSNVKILNHAYGMDLRVEDGVSTSDFIMSNCSIESNGFGTIGINITRLGTTGSFFSVGLVNNQLAGWPTAISITTAGIRGVNITGNIVGAVTNGIVINAGTSTDDRNIISDNYVSGTTGITVSAGTPVSSTRLVNNHMPTATTTPYSLAVSTFVVDTFYGIAYGSLPANVREGSHIYSSDANAGCTAGGSTGRNCYFENGAWTH